MTGPLSSSAAKMPLLALAFCIMSAVLFVVMGVDKALAKAQRFRVSERALFTLAILLGAVGGTLGMYLFRHKTQKTKFKVFFPLLALVEIALVVYVCYI